MKSFYLFLYYLIINKFPNTNYPGGKLFNLVRIFCVRQIFEIGINNKFHSNIYIGRGNNIKIGDNCQINDNIRFDNVIIGNNVMIARDCIFIGKVHNYSFLDIPMTEQGSFEPNSTIVEDNVWIGIRSIIMPGIEIKSGSVIAAGSVLTKSTIKNGVYAGVPARLIKIKEEKKI